MVSSFSFSSVNRPEQEQTVRLAFVQPAKVVVSHLGRQDLFKGTVYPIKRFVYMGIQSFDSVSSRFLKIRLFRQEVFQ